MADDNTTRIYYKIQPLVIINSKSAELTYLSEEAIRPGTIVEVSVRARKLPGVVISTCPKPEFETKPILKIIDTTPLPKYLLHLYDWISNFYNSHPVSVWQTMLPRGINKTRRINQFLQNHPERDRTQIVFTDDQINAISGIESSTSKTCLLHGITGSGKTAVYIELARRQQRAGKSTIVLVPEIALTSQLISDFLPHFPEVIVTHSTMPEAERHKIWLKCLHSKEPVVIIGPRSALFSPLKNLGLIIIDECHESTFRQDQTPKYSALRVASKLAEFSGAKLVLGSATPSIVDYYIAKKIGAPIAVMNKPARANTQLPKVTIVNMTKQDNFTKHRFFSNSMLASIQDTLDSGNQVLIFHNRRGTAPTTLCEKCGWSAICPRCFVPLTLHHDMFTLRCHICNESSQIPTACPDCLNTKVIHKGIGTKMIENELHKLFAQHYIARFDGDTESSQTVEKLYQKLYDSEIKIIIGTQVIAKGLDLPNLRMVGVVQADSGLSLPDYQSSEKTFQLIAQVCGRVGRNEHPSQVVVQSYQPDHPAVKFGVAQDYQSFYSSTILERKRAGFPPFNHLAKCVCSYKTEKSAILASQKLAKEVRKILPSHADTLGPTPAFYERVRDNYRWQIILRSPVRQDLVDITDTLPKNKNWQFELDPSSLL